VSGSHGWWRGAMAALVAAASVAALILGLVVADSTPAAPGPRMTQQGVVAGWAIVSARGHLVAGEGAFKVRREQAFGIYGIVWKNRFPANCATTAAVDLADSPSTEKVRLPSGATPFVAGYAVGDSFGKARHRGATTVQTFNQQGKPTALAFDVTVVC
jgi:hypothetical protein